MIIGNKYLQLRNWFSINLHKRRLPVTVQEKLVYTTASEAQYRQLFDKDVAFGKSPSYFHVLSVFSRLLGTNFTQSVYVSQQATVGRLPNFEQKVVAQVKVIEQLGRGRFRVQTSLETEVGQKLIQGNAVIIQDSH